MEYTIGEFSQITLLSIKSLRLYHEKELLIPARVDEFTGYRYDAEAGIETARTINILKQFDFSLAKIREILTECEQEEDALLIAGHRMKGRYQDYGDGIEVVAKAVGRHINGKAMSLYYDGEYKEKDTDFEPCFPVRKGTSTEAVSVRELPGGRCVSIIHKGPYDTLHDSYHTIYKHIKEKGYQVQLPTRKVYLKDPGMIFKGNPTNYLTEIQILMKDETHEIED